MSEYFSDRDNEQSFDMPDDNQFTSAPEVEQSNSSPYQSPGATEGSENKNQDMVYMAVMTIIILVMLYSLYSMFFSGSSESDQDKTSTTPIVENLNQPEKSEVTAPISTPIQEKVVPKTTDTSISSTEQKKIADNIKDLTDENNYLMSMVRKLSTDNQATQDRFKDLESEIDDLVSKNEAMQKKIADLEKNIEPKKTVTKTQPMKTYTVEAVVEGRAWIVSSDGMNKTVKVGDKLSTYGVISKIDPVNSIVYTTSNREIKVN